MYLQPTCQICCNMFAAFAAPFMFLMSFTTLVQTRLTLLFNYFLSLCHFIIDCEFLILCLFTICNFSERNCPILVLDKVCCIVL